MKLINTLVFVACGWFAATAALASPKLVYTFETTTIGCASPQDISPACATMAVERERLNTTFIGLAPSALSNGSATFKHNFVGGGGPTDPSINSGVELLSVYLYLGNHTQVFPQGFVMDPFERQFPLLIDISLSVGQYLTGSLALNNGISDITMSTALGGTEWQGSYRSDALAAQIFFTGNWRFSNVVSEPSTVALLLAALALVAAATRRRTAPPAMANVTR